MMKNLKKYHLHKNDYSKLHFEINNAKTYTEKNIKHCFTPHQHSFYQLIWFETEGQHFIDYETIKHEANTFFFIDKSQVHHFCKSSENCGWLFHFNDFFLHKYNPNPDKSYQQNLFNGIGISHVLADDATVEQISIIKNLIQEQIHEKGFNYQKEVYFLFQVILSKIERLKQAQNPKKIENNKDFKVIVEFKRLIEHYLDSFMTVKDFSEKLNISSKKLTALTKQYLDETPADVINKRKILEAKRLLSNTKASIKEIAFELGFKQATYFSKYFKKYTQYTPKDFTEHFINQN